MPNDIDNVRCKYYPWNMDSLETLLQRGAEWDLAGLVREANARLPRYLPQEFGSQRVREAVTARLVRHYTGLGMLDEPLRVGREARYSARHLLQLLVVRRLMAEGHGASALGDLARRKSDAELLAMLEGGVALTAKETPSALSYLTELRQQYRMPTAPIPSAAPLPVEAAPPAELRWRRFEIVPGLELPVREDFRLPKTPSELDAVLRPRRERLETQKPRRR